jgi:ubiquinone/menaquinone biosynthesis C-methylase UbiE
MFNYAQFWVGREYEHHAEVIALRRLLSGHRFGHAIDIGGGYGRLSVVLAEFADRVTLADPSSQQLELSWHVFGDQVQIERELMAAAHLKFDDDSVDLAVLVRVLHHLPDPEPEFAELSRVLRPGGYAVIEAANSVHARRRISAFLHGRPASLSAVDIRTEDSRRRGTAPYLNHHPVTIARQLAAADLNVRRVLSVSNLRHPLPKTLLPHRTLLALERAAQQPLARFHFGPSAFFLVQKAAAPSRRPQLTALPGARPAATRRRYSARHRIAAR